MKKPSSEDNNNSDKINRHGLPNVVFILIDDFGWVDLGCYGSKFYKTPNVDRMASEGMKFTQAYTAAPVCLPTRTCLLTGVSPSTLRMVGIPGDCETRDRPLIPVTFYPLPDEPEEVRQNMAIPEKYNSFGDIFKQQGYDTCYSGKWHSGTRGSLVLGFDKVISEYMKDWCLPVAWEGNSDGHVTKNVTTDAIEYINNHANRANPFLLYINHFTVHVPHQADESTIEYFSDNNNAKPDDYQTNITYAAMVKEMDDSIGAIMNAIKDNGIDNNTMVIFYSDNGGLSRVKDPKTGEIVTATNQYPLRSGKGTLYEGGIRVPFIVRYPGVVPAGKAVDTAICSQDFYPTFADFIGGSKPSYLEGISIKNILTGDCTETGRDTLYFHYPQYKAGWEPVSAIRKGDFKLLFFWETKRFELYDISKEISENNNIADSNKLLVDEMWRMLKDYFIRTNAPIPVERK
ncbi:MAG: sulfatase [Saccharofermentanales bacterium]